jgi:hypothetical protein
LPSTVTNLNDAGSGSLRDAIAITPSDGTVDFQAGLSGTIILTTGELAITKDLAIAGPGADLITVSGNHLSRVFDIIGAAFTVDISGMTIANGRVAFDSARGGGILNLGTLTVTNSTLSGNSASGFDASQGGGIFNGGTLTVTNSTLSDNLATYDVPGFPVPGLGGGIFNTGTLTVTNSTVSGNRADLGGGIFNTGTLTVTNSTVSGNWANLGGGIYTGTPGTLTVTNSTLSGNSAFGDDGAVGGGISNEGGTLTVSNSTISGNFASAAHGLGCGGGIFNREGGTVTVTNSTLSGNFAQGGIGTGTLSEGGGIYNIEGGTLTVTNSTLSRNRSSNGGGGGISNEGGLTHSRNTIIAGNTALDGAPDLLGNLGSQGHNLIGNSQGGTGFDPSDLLNINPLLGPLQNNGGPTQTMALLPGSPAIDAGNNVYASMWDQRGPGFPRIIHGTIDIGAFEYRAPRQLDPNPVPVSEPGPALDITQTSLPPPEPTLDLAIEALATAVALQPETTVYAMTVPLPAFVHDHVLERFGDLVPAGWDEK